MSNNSTSGGKKRKLCPPKEPEDWCFECKDGGKVIVCDRRNCVKVYHTDCVPVTPRKDKSWICAWHYCYECKESAKFYCLGCPNALCKECLPSSEFITVKGDKGLCCDCAPLVKIIEQNLERDSQGNKIRVDGRDTYEGLFKEYWEIIKLNEGLTSDDISAAETNYNKKVKKSPDQSKVTDVDKESQNDSMSSDGDEVFTYKHNSTKRKQSSSLEFMGWGSKPLLSFLASIGKFSTEPLSQWGIRTLVCEYIEKNNLYLSQDKRKFLLDEMLFSIFRKKVMLKNQIYPLLEFHFAEKSGDTDGEEDNYESISTPPDNKGLSDQTSCRERSLSSSKGKLLLEKKDLSIKPSRFASISSSNIRLIYLRQSLVLELCKQLESAMEKVVGAFVRVKMDSSDCKQTRPYHLVRVKGVVLEDDAYRRMLLVVSFMSEAIPISELSDNDFTEQECEDLRLKVKAKMLQKLTVVELQERANILHEDITKHWIATRLTYLQNQIDRANLKGRQREKFALLDEREKLQQPWKQEELLKRVPSVVPEFPTKPHK
ncbi:uncharacterized protein At5g08430 [Arachis hypogaea]|uniref:Uncharacterized protein n=2 Tax=Arachis TaxID=3817 RepID=A0A445CP28_ARAHY|nr:uncharacterized protein At5g08430 [Arachis hypogaea]QHO45570.1 uncharacterized protein DS421_6g180070 [Arachis hypogaea]RYR52669.1 hypothetical protein Ahy_A06g027559 [Arachis hypogaea]